MLGEKKVGGKGKCGTGKVLIRYLPTVMSVVEGRGGVYGAGGSIKSSGLRSVVLFFFFFFCWRMARVGWTDCKECMEMKTPFFW